MDIIKKLADDDSLRISWYSETTDLLGPYSRFALWVQGCCRYCEGCIALEMQDIHGGKCVKISSLAETVLMQKNTEGITISGGEPFYQADKLAVLIENIRSRRPDFGVIVYTGYTINELRMSGEKGVLGLLNLCDILIDGPYKEELDDNCGFRGSSNQRVIPLTDRYLNNMEQYESLSGRKSSFVFSENRLQMIGIPSQTAKEILKKSIL